jgi:cholesterol oxidase
MTRLARPLDELRPTYDAIVIGSGYGGGVAASRLARAGKRVCVLERGREVVTGEFPTRFPDLRADVAVTADSWRLGPETALFHVRIGKDMHVLTGSGLGGGSLVNAGVALRPDPRVFADPVWPAAVRDDGLIDEGYRRAAEWLRPVRHRRAAEMTKLGRLAACAGPLGLSPVATPVAVSFEDTINAAGVAQPACTLCGDCCGGCNVGAKNTVALTYLADAARLGAAMFTGVSVRRVVRNQGGTWNVEARRSAAEGEATLVVSAPVVVLAAGTLGSTEILLRSREAGLAVSDQLGQRFSANGDIIAFGYGATEAVNAVGVGYPSKVPELEVGASVTGQVEFTDAADVSRVITVQEGVLPSALAPMLPALFVPNGRLLGALQSLISGVYKGPFARLQTFFGVSHDAAAGTFSLVDDRLTLSWPGAKDQEVYRRLDEALGRLVAEAGGKYVRNPLAGTVMGHQPATAHPLGGCGMGEDRGAGVVDHKGRVFDGASSGTTDVHHGLYVVDGAVMARSLGVNPLLTITALAERAVMHMAQDLGFAFDAAPHAVQARMAAAE